MPRQQKLTAAFERVGTEVKKKIPYPTDGTFDNEQRAIEWDDTNQEWIWVPTVCDLPAIDKLDRLDYGVTETTSWEFTTAQASKIEEQFVGRFLRLDRYKMANWPTALSSLTSIRYLYAYYGDYTGATGFMEFPTIQSTLDYFYLDYGGLVVGQAPGDAGISDIPTTWRNLTGVFRFYMRRLKLSTAQMDGIIAGFDREITAGMGDSYTGTHIVYLNLTGSNANAAPTQATHVANGWTAVSATRLEKTFNGRLWRIEHNA